MDVSSTATGGSTSIGRGSPARDQSEMDGGIHPRFAGVRPVLHVPFRGDASQWIAWDELLLLLSAKRHLKRTGIFASDRLRDPARTLDQRESATLDVLLDELATAVVPGFSA